MKFSLREKRPEYFESTFSGKFAFFGTERVKHAYMKERYTGFCVCYRLDGSKQNFK